MNSILRSFGFVSAWLGECAKYLYLSRVPLVGLILLTAFPIMATGSVRSLVIGAYDLGSFREALLVALSICAVVASTYLTAQIVWELSAKRYDFVLHKVSPTIRKLWISALGLALALNVIVAIRVSDKAAWPSILGGMLTGILISGLMARRAGWAKEKFGFQVLRDLVFGFMISVGLERGYVSYNSDGEPETLEAGHTTALAFTVFLAAFYAILVQLEIPALVTVMMVIAMSVLALSAATFLFDYYRVPLLVGIVGYCALMARWWQNDHYYRVWPVEESARVTKITPRAIVTEAVRQNRPIVVVASAGGGIQSTAWTTATLSRIGDELEGVDFPGSVRLISGVSGGSVGGLFYAMAVDLKEADRFKKTHEAAQGSGLERAMRGLLRDDVVRAIAPFFIRNGSNFPLGIYSDRGHELEKAWIESAEKQFPGVSTLGTATLSQWGADAMALRRPALIFNSTLVETGERFAISTVPTSRANPGSCEFAERYNADIAMTTAARLSATFPLISPTARPGPSRNAESAGYSLPGPEFWPLFPRGGNYLHAVDGGYYENSGIVAAVEWLDEAFSEMVHNGEPLPKQVLFIELNAFPLGEKERVIENEDDVKKKTEANRMAEAAKAMEELPPIDAGQHSHGTLYDLISPLPAMINVRNAGQKAFATRVLELFRARWKGTTQGGNSTPITIIHAAFYYDFADKKEPSKQSADFFIGADPHHQPLSWHLRPCEKKDIQSHLDNLKGSEEFTKVKDFFNQR